MLRYYIVIYTIYIFFIINTLPALTTSDSFQYRKDPLQTKHLAAKVEEHEPEGESQGLIVAAAYA